jgi:hypothetical protein
MLALWCCIVSGYTRAGPGAGAGAGAGGDVSGEETGTSEEESGEGGGEAENVDVEDVEDELVLRVFPRCVASCSDSDMPRRA